MTHIDTFEDYCIYREFIDDDTLHIIVYSARNKKFYELTLTNEYWHQINSNFSLKELELIFKVCIDKKSHYTLTVSTKDNNLVLSFVCIELIKAYKWQLELGEKSLLAALQINQMFHQFRYILDTEYTNICNNFTTYLSNIQNNEDNNYNTEVTKESYEIMANSVQHLENNIANLLLGQNKEVLMLPYIANLNKIIAQNEVLVAYKPIPAFLNNTVENKKEYKSVPVLNNCVQNKKEYNEDEIDEEELEETDSDSDEEIFSDDDDDDEDITKTDYDKFLANKIKELRAKNPGLYRTQYIQMAVKEWTNQLNSESGDEYDDGEYNDSDNETNIPIN